MMDLTQEKLHPYFSFCKDIEKTKIYNDYKYNLNLSKLFIVDNQKHWLFTTTKPATIKEELKLGFNNIFISDIFQIDEKFGFCGLLLALCHLGNEESIKEAKNIGLTNINNLVSICALVRETEKCRDENNQVNFYICQYFLELQTGKIFNRFNYFF